jgi:hypothetical protein
MPSSAEHHDGPSGEGRQPVRPAWTVALFVAVSWAAVVFAIDGLIAFASGRDPVPPGVDPYYGLLALAAAGVVVWLAVALGVPASSPVLPALVAAAAVYLVIVGSGLAGGLRLLAVQATSPFTVVAAVTAAAAVVATWTALRVQRRNRT